MAVVDELVTILRTVVGDGSDRAIFSYQKGIKGVVETVKEAAKQLTIASSAFTAFVGAAVNSAASIQTASEMTGVSTDALQEWAYVANQVGVSAGAVQGDLAKLQKQALWTGRSIEDWADHFKGMSAPIANMWGDAIGISPDTVRALREGREGLAKLKKEAHDVGAVINPEDLKRAKELKTSVMSLTAQLRSFGTTVAIGTIPFVQKLVTSFREWLNANKEWVATNITRFLEGLGKAFNELWEDAKKVGDWFMDTLGPVGDFAKKLWDATDVATLLKGAIGMIAIALAPLAVQFVAVTAAVVAVSAAIEDWLAFMEGKDSLIGRFVDSFTSRFPNLANLLKNVVAVAFDLVTKAAKGMWDLLVLISKGIGGVVDLIITGLDKAIGKFREFFGLKDLSEQEPEQPEVTKRSVTEQGARRDNPLYQEDLTEPDKTQPAPTVGQEPAVKYEVPKREPVFIEDAMFPEAKEPETPAPAKKQSTSSAPSILPPVGASIVPPSSSEQKDTRANVQFAPISKEPSAKSQLQEAGKELAKGVAAMQSVPPQQKDPFMFPRTEIRQNTVNKTQTSESNWNAHVTISVNDPNRVGDVLKSIQEMYPDSQVNAPGTYGPSVG